MQRYIVELTRDDPVIEIRSHGGYRGESEVISTSQMAITGGAVQRVAVRMLSTRAFAGHQSPQ